MSKIANGLLKILKISSVGLTWIYNVKRKKIKNYDYYDNKKCKWLTVDLTSLKRMSEDTNNKLQLEAEFLLGLYGAYKFLYAVQHSNRWKRKINLKDITEEWKPHNAK